MENIGINSFIPAITKRAIILPIQIAILIFLLLDSNYYMDLILKWFMHFIFHLDEFLLAWVRSQVNINGN